MLDPKPIAAQYVVTVRFRPQPVTFFLYYLSSIIFEVHLVYM